MLKVALRGLMAHKSRLVTTFFAVALGVAFVGGVLVLTDTVNRTFNDLFSDVYKDTDAVVRSDQTIDQGFAGGGEVRGLIDESLLDDVLDIDGVADADVAVDGYARIIDKDGEPVGDPAMGAPTFGTNWGTSDTLNPFTIVEGEGPQSDDELVIDKASADSTGYEVGDTVPVQTRSGTNEFTLSGIARFGTADSPGGASFAMWTVEEAQAQLGEPGKVSSISVAADDGVSQTEVVDAIRDGLGSDAGVQVITGEQITEETQNDIQEALSFLTIFLGFFGVIAVVVGAFVIYNAFSIIVAQRTREMALLRAVGARRRQVRRAVLAEAVVVGVAGSVVGFLLGLGVAALLAGFLGLPDSSLAILPGSVAIALAVGIIVTLVSALIPAWRASRVPPLAALRDVAVDTSGRSRLRLVLGAVVLVLAVVLVAVGAFGSEPAQVGLGVLGVFAGTLLISPVLARPVATVLGAPVARLRGVAGELARDNAARNPRRTASTAFALMIGVGLVSFFLVLNASVRQSIDEALSSGFRGDFIVTTDDFGLVGLPPSVGDDIAELSEVDEVVPFRFAPAFVGTDTSAVTGTNEGVFDLFEIDVVEGSADLASGNVIIDRDTATSERIGVGRPGRDPLHRRRPGRVPAAGHRVGDLRVGADREHRLLRDRPRRLRRRRHQPERRPGVRAPGRRRVGGRRPAGHPRGGRPVPDGRRRERRPVQGHHQRPVRPDPHPDRGAAVPGDHHRLPRHRQHDRPVGARAHPRAGPAAGRRHAPQAGALRGAVGVGDHLAVRHRARAGRGPARRLGHHPVAARRGLRGVRGPDRLADRHRAGGRVPRPRSRRSSRPTGPPA